MSKLTKNHCLKCKQLFTVKRNPNQQYCSQGTCQNTRKSEWHKAKRSNDPDYQHNHNAACKNWREQNKGYCRKYRDTNPKYAQRNRQLQRDRDCRRANARTKSHASHLAKSDALTATALVPEGRYHLIPEDCNLAKSDALLVNIAVISKSYGHKHDLAKI